MLIVPYMPAHVRAETTLAQYASYGWLLTLYCLNCKTPRRTLNSRQIVERFGDHLLATVEEVCARLACEACDHRGGFWSGFADRDPWREEGARKADRVQEINIWQARDLFLQKLLAEAGRSLEIADAVWAELEARAVAERWSGWKPRVGPREGQRPSLDGRS